MVDSHSKSLNVCTAAAIPARRARVGEGLLDTLGGLVVSISATDLRGHHMISGVLIIGDATGRCGPAAMTANGLCTAPSDPGEGATVDELSVEAAAAGAHCAGCSDC